MTRFHSILLPHDGSPEAAKAMGCAGWLAERLGATLHVLTPTTLQIARAHRARMVLHQTAEAPESAVPKAIAAHSVELVVMTARGESASAGIDPTRRLGGIAQALIEQSPVPVLLLPLRYREVLPWRSMLVAASGEAVADRALETAVQLAGALHLRVAVVHCADRRAAPGALGAYADAPQHEYPGRLEEMVKRALSDLSSEECECIEEVTVCRGDTASGLLAQLARRSASVLALGWHGDLGAGRAPVLKRLLEEAECPLLVVRSTERSGARLKVGEQIDD